MNGTKAGITADSVFIRQSKRGDFNKYARMLQKSIEVAYSSRKLGLDRSLFSVRVFSSEGMQNWMKDNLYPASGKWTFVATYRSRIVGAITVKKERRRNELRAFYVDPRFQGLGVGKKLLKHALRLSLGKEIVLTMYPHNLKTFLIYKRWGFRRYGTAGYHHWSAWPDGVRMRYARMLLPRNSAQKLYKSI
jgi:GNAT superfamily N-acetyltransferase